MTGEQRAPSATADQRLRIAKGSTTARSLSKQHLGLSARNTVLGKVPNDSSQLEGPRDGGEIGEIGEQYQRNRHGIEESDKPKPTTTQVVSDDIAVRAGRLRRFDLHE